MARGLGVHHAQPVCAIAPCAIARCMQRGWHAMKTERIWQQNKCRIVLSPSGTNEFLCKGAVQDLTEMPHMHDQVRLSEHLQSLPQGRQWWSLPRSCERTASTVCASSRG